MTITKFDFPHSLKNIPIPSKDNFIKLTITKTEQFIQRLRWKAHFSLNPMNNPNNKNTFGFKTKRNAPQIPELVPFEEDLTNMISNIEFKTYRNDFQNKLLNDARKFKRIYLSMQTKHIIFMK